MSVSQWSNKPPILYTLVKLQELQLRLQNITTQEQLLRAKALLNHELKKVKKDVK